MLPMQLSFRKLLDRSVSSDWFCLWR